MPLARQPLFLPLGLGIRRDNADLVLPIGQGTLGLANCFIDRTGQIVKRKGATTVTNTTTAGGSLPAPWQLATYKGSLVAIGTPGFGGQPFATYSETAAKWATVPSDMHGAVSMSKMPVNDFVGAGAAVTGSLVHASDLAYSGGYYLAAYRDQTAPTSYFDLLDATTGAKLASFTAANAHTPKCGFVSGFLVGLYITTTGQLRKVTFNLSTYAVTDSLVNLIAAISLTDAIMDVRTLPATGGISCIYKDNASLLHETIFTSGLVASEYIVTDQTNTPINNLLMWTYVQPLSDDGSVRSLITFDSLNGCRGHFSLATSGANQRAATTVVFDAAAKTNLITGAAAYSVGPTFGDIQCLWTRVDIAGTTGETHGVQYVAGILAGPSVLYRQMGIVSKAWKISDDYYVLARDQFGSGFVLKFSYSIAPAPVARAYRGTLGSLGVGYQPNVPTVGGNPRILVSNVLSVEGDAGTHTETRGIEILNLDYPTSSTPPTIGRPVEAIDSLFVPTGSQLNQYDGRSYAEVGFPYAPTIETATPVAGGSLTANSTYRYQLVYLTTDNNGNAWRSAPSLPTDVAISGANQSVTLAFRFLNLTGRPDAATWVEIYRSAANDSSLLTLVTRIQNNAGTGSLGSYTDTTADTAIASALPIYTTGGIAESEPLPPTNNALFALNRMWIVDADNPTRLWPSKSVIPGQGLRFSEADAISLADVSATPITALAALDDKVIAFKSDRIYAITGDGADQAGNGGFNVNTIAIGIGTTNPQSVVTFPFGVFFDAAKGIQLLDRGLSISSPIQGTTYVGQPIEDGFSGFTIMASIHLPKLGQIRLYTGSGSTAVMDYLHWAWSIYDGQPTNTATVWKDLGAYWAGNVLAESDSVYYEGTPLATYSLAVSTPWVSFAGVGALERVYRFQGIGLTIGNHTCTVTLRINGDSTAITTKARAMTTGEVLWAWELRPRVQKFSACQLTIVETFATATAGPAIVGVSLMVGSKVGLRKLYAPSARLT